VFWPAPNVDSGLVAFDRREPPETPASREEVFAVIEAAFSQRRKTIRSALARWMPDRERLDEVFRTTGIDSQLRGEMLGITEFATLAGAGRTL
jgi:16S rRNA (adenine1518-N6/adenine1519-N6)-dimethyltransferase